LPDGRIAVADTLNDRVVLLDGPAVRELWPADGSGWAAPTFVRATPDGGLLVTDSGQRRVVALGLDGQLRWQYGAQPGGRRPLAFPRMAEATAAGTVLVADTFHHRVLEFDGAGEQVWQAGPGLGLHAPRSVTRDAGGRTVIADGMNARVLVVDGAGSPVREISEVRWQGERHRLVDPHHVVAVGEQLLITDSDTDCVWLVDSRGDATRQWGGGPDSGQLDDPHCAWLRPDGSLVVADAGNHRLALCAPGPHSGARALPVLDAAGQPVQLDYPRCVSLAPGGGLLVADTDAARLLGVDAAGVVRWELGPELPADPGLGGVPELRIPRWVALDARGRLVITDYWNSRVLVYATAGGPGDRTGVGPE
jgi:DNA-binding beta-propeller fold protein YncE